MSDSADSASRPLRPWSDFDHATLADELAGWGFPASHAAVILRGWHRTGGSLDDWTAGRIGPRLARQLYERIAPISSQVLRRHDSADGTAKLLVGFLAGGAAEAVLMPAYRPGRAMACLSSQIGCAMGCDFCASTRNGVERSLSTTEIVEQFVHLQSAARDMDRRVTSVVFMGMGEPMLNLDAIIPAIRIIAHPDLGGVGWRQVTVSTVGIVPGIDRLAEADLNVHLAVSLHAADDTLRSQIVPMNRKYDISAVLAAANRFFERSGRIVTIEWCLLAAVNDTMEQADRLATLLRDRDMLRAAHVNVIPFNPIGPGLRGVTYVRPTALAVKTFIERLQLAGVVCHKRDTRGDDVSAACGQLAVVA